MFYNKTRGERTRWRNTADVLIIDGTLICSGTMRLINRHRRVINRQSRVLRGDGRGRKRAKGRRNFDSHYRYGISERDDRNFNGGLITFRRRRTRANARGERERKKWIVERGRERVERKGERIGVKTSDDRYHREHCEARIDHNYCPY